MRAKLYHKKFTKSIFNRIVKHDKVFSERPYFVEISNRICFFKTTGTHKLNPYIALHLRVGAALSLALIEYINLC